MPLYEYRCECGKGKETLLEFSKMDTSQMCSCGKMMLRKVSLPYPPIMTPTANGMTLDMLNSKDTAYIKPEHKQIAAQGLESTPKAFY